MFDHRDQIKPNEEVRCVSADAASQLVGLLLLRVTPFTAGSQVHQLLEALGTSWYRRIESGILIGLDVNDRPHFRFRLTEDTVRTFVDVSGPNLLAVSARGSFDRTIIGRPMPLFRVGMASHLYPRRTDRNALLIDLFGGTGRGGRDSASRIECNDGGYLGVDEILVNPQCVMPGIINAGGDLHLRSMV